MADARSEYCTMNLLIALLVIAAAVYLMVRRVDVRLILLGAGLLMAVVAGKPLVILDTFTQAMVTGMVAPICAAMGFAAVLNATACDRHLIHLLLAPIRRFRRLVVPGGILVAYLVNVAVPSQTSTAAAIGPILVPLMLAAGVGLETAGAALILGASFGGDLLNPGAQDVQGLSGVANISAPDISLRVVPASIAGALVAAFVFMILNRRHAHTSPKAGVVDAGKDTRLNLVKALIPLVPITLLLLAYSLQSRMGERSPLAWLLALPSTSANAKPKEIHEWERLAGALPVVRAMLIGALLAAAVSWRDIQKVTRSLFEGMGAAYGNIIALTITAQCFGAGIAAIGLSDALLGLLGNSRFLAPVFSVSVPWSLAVLSGSGSGPILAFGKTFLAYVEAHHDTATLGAMTCLAGAFGRTMSPVAAVVVYSSGLVGLSPITLIRRLLPALLAGAVVALGVVMLRSS
jgi:DcuC family C4-dicarboxylate transporter